MATLQKIRDHAGKLVMIIVGVALLAFVVGDLFKSDGTFGSSRNNVGTIAGTDIPIQYYQAKVDENSEIYKSNRQQNSLESSEYDQIQDETWDQLVRQYVIEEEYAKAGVSVSADELYDMVQGNFIDPQVMQVPIFRDAETGQFDRNLVMQYLKNKDLDPSGQAAASWASFERALVQNKMDQKFLSLVGMGMYTTGIQAQKESDDKNTKYDFDYVQLRYSSVSDSLVKVGESDLKNYYSNHKKDFEQDESRDIYYVVFPVVASDDDRNTAIESIEGLKDEFASKEGDALEQFVNLESDEPFNSKYLDEKELSEPIASLFDAADNTIVGPYEEGNYVKIARKLGTARIADSAEARHILIRPSADLTEEAAKAKADSIMNAIKKGASFAEMAEKFSADGSAQDGGNLGWFTEGMMVKEFNDACFLGKKGDIKVVETRFGFHVVEVLNQTAPKQKVKVAVIAREISASNKTVDAIYSVASRFGSSNRSLDAFRTNAEKEGISLRTANVKRNDRRLANFDNPRQIIRWAYKASRGEISEIFELDNQFVIAIVSGIHKKGVAPFNEVRNDIARRVLIEKKADYLISKLNDASKGASTLQSVADNLGEQMKEAKSVTYSSYSVPTVGVEPNLQAAMVTIDEQKISAPIKGNNGVFLIQVKSVAKAEDVDLNRERELLQRTNMSRAGYQVLTAIKAAADIEDNRSNFY